MILTPQGLLLFLHKASRVYVRWVWMIRQRQCSTDSCIVACVFLSLADNTDEPLPFSLSVKAVSQTHKGQRIRETVRE